MLRSHRYVEIRWDGMLSFTAEHDNVISELLTRHRCWRPPERREKQHQTWRESQILQQHTRLKETVHPKIIYSHMRDWFQHEMLNKRSRDSLSQFCLFFSELRVYILQLQDCLNCAFTFCNSDVFSQFSVHVSQF